MNLWWGNENLVGGVYWGGIFSGGGISKFMATGGTEIGNTLRPPYKDLDKFHQPTPLFDLPHN